MFTGIVEAIAVVREINPDGTNLHFVLECDLARNFRVDQSVAHSGVCLTVEQVNGTRYQVTAIQETLQKTALADWKVGYQVNIEQSLQVNDRLDGHFVQGHVDATAECLAVTPQDGSWLYRFRFPRQFAELVIEKGSICVNGVSLTIFDVAADAFSVAIIPFTYDHTNFPTIAPGCRVNVEFDILGKYILRRLQLAKG